MLSEEMIEKMVVAGMDIVRLNFSHGDHEDFRRTFNTVCIDACSHGYS